MGFSRQEYWSGVPLPSPEISITLCNFYDVTSVSKLFKQLLKLIGLFLIGQLENLYPNWSSESIVLIFFIFSKAESCGGEKDTFNNLKGIYYIHFSRFRLWESIYIIRESIFIPHILSFLSFPGGSGVKNPPANTDAGSTPESRRSPGIGNGNLLQYSCLKNPMDRGAWQATVHGVTKELNMT